jgi:hypothetical protein
MNDEAEHDTEVIYADGEHALATYGSHAAEIAQAFGNLVTQAMTIPLDHPFHAPALDMLKRLVEQVEVKPKGSMRAIKTE